MLSRDEIKERKVGRRGDKKEAEEEGREKRDVGSFEEAI